MVHAVVNAAQVPVMNASVTKKRLWTVGAIMHVDDPSSGMWLQLWRLWTGVDHVGPCMVIIMAECHSAVEHRSALVRVESPS